MKVNKIKSLTITLMAILIATFIISNNSNLMPTTVLSDDKSDAFDAIAEAFGKIEQATTKGLDVKIQVNLLNGALDDYNNGQYTDALNKAQEVIDQTDELLATITTGQLFPYILIPVNAVIIIAIIVLFRKNIVNWFKGRRDEEFLDMEIIYEEPEVEVIEDKPKQDKEK